MKIENYFDHRKVRKYHIRMWKVENGWSKLAHKTNDRAGVVKAKLNKDYHKRQYQILKNYPSKYSW